MTKHFNYYLLIPIIIVIALMVIGTLYDLQISLLLYDRDNWFALLGDYIGELPIYIMFPFSLSICFVYYRQFTSAKYIILSFFSVILTFFTLYVCINRFLSFLPLLVNLILTLAISFALMYGFHFIKRDTLEKLYHFALIALVVITLVLVCNQALKYLWGRYRFHNIYVANNLARFTPWYLPQGINGNKSFPSGHASSVTTLFLLVTLYSFFGNKKWVKILLNTLIAITVALICLSRVVYGAHYLTDVTMGFAISFVIFYTVQYYMLKRFNKSTDPRQVNAIKLKKEPTQTN